MKQNRYDSTQNYVEALPMVDERRRPMTIGVEPVLTSEAIHVGQPLAAHHGATEHTDAVNRALGLGIRFGFYLVLVLVLSVTLVKMAGGGWSLTFALFAGLSLTVFAVIDKREHMYSRNGLERHKVDSLTHLKEKEMRQRHELQKMVVESQIEMWRGVDYAGGGQIPGGGGKVARRITTQAPPTPTA